MTRVQLVAEHDHKVGEGPLYHPDEGDVYWVDIPTGRLFRYDPATGDSELALSVDRPLGGYTIQEDGSFALFLGKGGVARWDGNEYGDEPGDESDIEYVLDSIPGEEDSRFNDVIAAPRGRVFAGTMPTDDDPGTLYRIDPDGSYEIVDEDGYGIPNGMGFTPDRKSMYVTESEAYAIYRFEYDQATGELHDKELFLDTSDEEGFPDGMTVDEEGYVWSARWDGASVVRHDPETAEELERIEVPAPKASSLTFGGEGYGDMYVTTAKGHDAEDDPPAGSLFRIDAGVGGVPEFRSRI